jgi:hypothetical protein
MLGQAVFRPGLQPALPGLFIGIIFEIEESILLAAAPDDVDVVGKVRISRHDDGQLLQKVIPQHSVELSIAQMVGVVKERSEQGQSMDDLPQFRGDRGVVQGIGRRQRYAGFLQDVKQAPGLCALVSLHVGHKDVVKVVGIIGCHRVPPPVRPP